MWKERENMFEQEDTTYNDLRKNSFYSWLDRLFIDWFWVGKTKAWIIPGTEDLMPYIPKKTFAIKWVGTLVGYPLLAALLAWVLSRL